MKTEHEATFTEVNKDWVRTQLSKTQAVLVHAEMEYERSVFNPPEGIPGHVRIRKENDIVTLTYKQKIEDDSLEGNHWKEAEVVIDDFKNGIALVKGLGCTDRAFQVTKREKWVLDDVEVTIDTWPFLESYVEVEGQTMEEVQRVSEKLGFLWSEARFVNVTDLYMEKYGLTKEQINNRTPCIVFDEANPFVDRND